MRSVICPGCKSENQPGTEVCFSCGRSLFALTKGSMIAGRYEIEDLLGKGGMGTVYKARDTILDETVALKVLAQARADESALLRRFRSEIKLARKVTHPNVCRVYDAGEEAGLMYISMAFLEGIELKQRLSEHPDGLPASEAMRIAIQIAEGLEAIHEVGIIHRDLKTSNVMLDSSGQIQLMDFGIAKDAGAAGGMTADGAVMGTPEYMSPEQCRGDELSYGCDIYALGIVVWELLTGSVPFRGATMMSTLFKQIQEPPPFDGERGATLPAAVVPVLRKALEKSPAQRYTTIAEMLAALRAAHGALGAEEPAAAASATPESGPRTAVEADTPSAAEKPVGSSVASEAAGGTVESKEPATAEEAVGSSAASEAAGGAAESKEPAAAGEAVGSTAVSEDVASSAEPPEAERRSHPRVERRVLLRLQRIDENGAVVDEQETVAENLSLGGACVRTTMPNIGQDEVLYVTEVDGDFASRVSIRHRQKSDGQGELMGIAFLGQTLPDRLLAEESAPAASAPEERAPEDKRTPTGASLAQASRSEAASPAVETPTGASLARAADPSTRERRRHTRLGIHVDLMLRRLDDSGAVAQQERTISEDVSRGGLCVLTSMASIQVGEEVEIEEVGGDFKARAKVRHTYKGQDHVTRLGMEFMGCFAPDRLVPEDDLSRSRRGDSSRAPAVKAPPSAPRELTPPPVRIVDPAPAVAAPPRNGAASAGHDSGSAANGFDVALSEARQLHDREQYWDAIQTLGRAIRLSRSVEEKHTAQALMAESMSCNPKWVNNAEQILQTLLQENPRHVRAHFVLGKIYRSAGMRGLFEHMLHTVLELQPDHEEALAELRSLNQPSA